MRLEYLRYLISVVDLGSISKAANVLFISPQGLSQAIQQLERELNVQIFYRKGNRLTLTAAGDELYIMAKEMVQLEGSIHRRMEVHQKNVESKAANELFIVSTPIISSTFLPTVLNQTRKRNPNLKIQVLEIDPRKIVEQYPKHSEEIYIISLPEPELTAVLKDTPQALDFNELLRTPLMACVPKNSPLAGRDSIQLKQLLEMQLVIYGVEDRTLDYFVPDEGEVEAAVSLRSFSLPLCRSMLQIERNSVGFTNKVVEQCMKTSALVSIPIEPSIDMVFGYLVSEETMANPIYEEFIRIMVSHLQSN